MNIPDTNARGWPLFVLLDMDTHIVMRSEYKTQEEADEDNDVLKEYIKSRNWLWVPNDASK